MTEQWRDLAVGEADRIAEILGSRNLDSTDANLLAQELVELIYLLLLPEARARKLQQLHRKNELGQFEPMDLHEEIYTRLSSAVDGISR